MHNTDVDAGQISVNLNKSSLYTDSDIVFCNSYKDGTSTSREARIAFETAEVGYSQPWAQ